MAAPVIAGESGGNRIFRIGRVGWDSGTADFGGVYTSTVRTEKQSPAGEDGLTLFRRVYIRTFHYGTNYSGTVKVYVDGVQTKVNKTGAAATDQVELFSNQYFDNTFTPLPTESIQEIAISKAGTYIEVEISLPSNAANGLVMIESILVGHIPIREGRQRVGVAGSL